MQHIFRKHDRRGKSNTVKPRGLPYPELIEVTQMFKKIAGHLKINRF